MNIVVFLDDVKVFEGDVDSAKDYIRGAVAEGYDENNFAIYEQDENCYDAMDYVENCEELSVEDLSYYVV